MGLCEICRKVDVRQMLQMVAGGHFHWDTDPSKLIPGDCNYCRVQDTGIHHFSTYAALKAASDLGCDLCRLIRLSLKQQTDPACSDWEQISQEETDLSSSPVFFFPFCLRDNGELPKIRVAVGSGYSSEFTCTLEIFAPRVNFPPDGRGLLLTSIHADSAEPSCVAQASEWLQTCLRTHPRCGKARGHGRRPASRFIDVGPPNETGDVRLHLGYRQVSSWVALSYCWGNQSDFVLNDKTMSIFVSGVSLSKFPPTLRDAVAITRGLGVRYLWVDALCIRQDCEEDWRRESSRMRSIYNGAVVTLIAADAPSVQAGIFSKRTFKFDPCPVPWNAFDPVALKTVTAKETVYVRSASWIQETTSSPIQQRGWTLQEDLLSCRTLTYSRDQMIWECRAFKVDEAGRTVMVPSPNGKHTLWNLMKRRRNRLPLWIPAALIPQTQDSRIPSILSVNRFLVRRNIYHRWSTVVSEYTSRKLSRETDALPALAGLASEFARFTRDKYCAGLWEKDLLFGLMWMLHPVAAREKKTAPAATGPTAYRAPSWSWAAVNGSGVQPESSAWIAYDMLQVDSHDKAKIVEVQVELVASGDPFGQVKAGHVTLRGPFYLIGSVLESDSTTPAATSMSAAAKAVRKMLDETPTMRQEFQQQHRPCHDQRFALFKLIQWAPAKAVTRAEYLLLESTTSNHNELYRRIGYLALSDDCWHAAGGSSGYAGIEMALNDHDLKPLMENAFRELQALKGTEKTVTII